MQESTSKEKILKKIRKGLIEKTANPFPGLDMDTSLFLPAEDSLDILFAQNLIAAGGSFVFCENELEFIEHCIELASDNAWKSILCVDENLQALLDACEFPYVKHAGTHTGHQVVITSCENLIARTGSVLISSEHSGRRASAFSAVHILISYTSQLVFDIKDALIDLRKKYEEKIPSMISIVTGPSSTADIEGKIIQGVPGPSEIFVFMIDDVPENGR